MAGGTRFVVPAILGDQGQPKTWYVVSYPFGHLLFVFREGSTEHRNFMAMTEVTMEGTGVRVGGLTVEFDTFGEVVHLIFEDSPYLRGDVFVLPGESKSASKILKDMSSKLDSARWGGFLQEDRR